MFATDFESENRSFKARKNSIAVVVTIAIHALIILFLIFTILHTPNPPYEDNGGGMAVNFGTDEVGMGDEQPFTYTPGESQTAPPPVQQNQPEASSQEDLLSQETEESEVEAPKVEPSKKKVNNDAILKPSTKPNNTPVTTPTKNKPVEDAPPAQQADPNALFGKKGAPGANKNGSDGTGNRPGDQGDPNGDPNSRNYEGGPGTGDGPGSGGNGNGFSLRGRSKVSLPAPQQCTGQGKVVVDIKVNRDGYVTDAKVRMLGTTSVDACTKNNALIAAKKAKFNPDPNAPEEQAGTITYIYKVQ